MIPPALWRASTITGCPTLSEIFCPCARVRMSGAPPGEELTMKRMGLDGYACACAAIPKQPTESKNQKSFNAEDAEDTEDTEDRLRKLNCPTGRECKGRAMKHAPRGHPSTFILHPSRRKPPGFLRRHPRRRREDEVLLGEQLLAPAPRFGVAPLVRLGASVYRLGVADPAKLRFELARHPGVAPLL